MPPRKAIIIGAGPAGLTAAYELLKRSGIQPVVLEKSTYMGGISRTANYKGNRMDMGGHRFFSKSDRVMRWWLNILPLQSLAGGQQTITYRQMRRHVESEAEGPDPAQSDKVMLLRPRRSRIYCLRHFFDYPITLSPDTLKKLGARRTVRIGLSYCRSALFPIRPEQTLEEFFINRFGRELYLTFFKSYTEKVWGTPCSAISAEWGAQRIKGLSVWATLSHAVKKLFTKPSTAGMGQKSTETSLIEQFLYPKYGPGQMWEEVARQVQERGGMIRTQFAVEGLDTSGSTVTAVRARNLNTGHLERFEGDYFFSTMPVRDLLRAFETSPPSGISEIGEGLVYRDFIAVGLLVNRLRISDQSPQGRKLISDNWIYIQEPDVLVGRLQIFNNWSPYMVADPQHVWLGLEYFCNEADDLWKASDQELIRLGSEELHKIGILDKSQVIDGTVVRVEKAYPAYFGTYDRFQQVVDFVNQYHNLYLVGRNGMHKYNNQDHSMLTAMIAVDNILAGLDGKSNIWAVNMEQHYHEEEDAE